MIEVHELQVFLAAAEQENFSAAGRKLHLSQPAISFQIQSLEQHLNVQLFQRTGRRITLTEAGRDLLPMAREMVNLSSRIEETMCEQQGLVKGQLVIGCSTSPGKYILPHLVGAFHQRFPAVHVSVEVMDRETVEAKLVGQEIHIGVVGICSKKKELECWPFFTDELVLIVAAGHPWAACRSISPGELATQDWILREGGAATRQLVLSTLAGCGISSDQLRVPMELGSAEAVEAAVEAGHGVSIVSRVAVRRGLEMGRIKTVGVEGLSVEREIFFARSRLRTCTCAQLRFREFVESPEGQSALAECLA
ncbi:MAG: selenium metabolism-associated LysR family transcriptional regulator [Chloroflexi bacterium]|nr:selenium metabolism-associated LysR family transcriptional regulator [Chloroflexota bacterium]